jgi:hypothetical protein
MPNRYCCHPFRDPRIKQGGGGESCRLSLLVRAEFLSIRFKILSPRSWVLLFSDEALLMGSMVIGFGELEILFGICAGLAIEQKNVVLMAFHEVNTSGPRIKVANALAAQAIINLGYKNEYAEAYGALNFCQNVRNQYAHCQFGHSQNGGVMFTKTEGSFSANGITPNWKGLTLALLKEQEAYFVYTRSLLMFLEDQIPYAIAKRNSAPHYHRPIRQKPARIPQPPKHTDL